MSDPRDREIERAWREASREEPPRRLDEAILARSREAVAGRGVEPPSELWPLAHPRSWLMRWRVPLAVTATLVVSATLTLLVYDYGVETPPPVVAERPAAEREPPPPWDAAKARAPAPSAEPRADAGPPAPPLGAPQAPSEARARPEPAAPRAPAAKRGADARSREIPTAAAPPASGAAAEGMAPEATAAPPAAAPAAGAGAARPAEKREQAIERLAREEAALATPEAYVERIRALKRAGRNAEARELLEELQRRFPGFALPEDLRPAR